MKNLILLGLAFSLALFSCNNDDDAEGPIVLPPVVEEPVFFPLTEGNYWIYENVQVGPDGTESLFGTTTDSIYVAGDSIINGITFTQIRGKRFGLSSTDTSLLNLVRESEGEIITVSDRTILSTTNFTDILQVDTIPQSEDPILIIEYRMREVEDVVSIPAGDFEDAINYEGKVFVRPTTLVDSIRFRDNIYAEDIGRVFSTTFFVSRNSVIESRLLRFNVQ